MTSTVTFPGLGLEFTLNRVAFSLFGKPIYWYGIIIAGGFLLAVWFCCKRASQFGLTSDGLLDMLLFAVPIAILGARAYYVVTALSRDTGEFRTASGAVDWPATIRIWDGGLAIYGGVIAAVATVVVFCKVRHEKIGPYLDLGSFGLLIGQAIGRWGNFVNVEAYGYETTLPWRMGVENVFDSNTGAYLGVQEVHPTFLYESLWNLVGLVLMVWILKKGWRKFDGQMFCIYLAWYGVGRGWIEGLRRDYLPFFGLEIGGAPLRVSQVLAWVFALGAIGFLVYHLAVKKHTPEELYVNQKMEEKAHDDPGREGPGGEAEG